MANSDFQFNIAKGQIKTLFNNVDSGSPSTSRIIVVPIETTGLEDDSTLQDYDDLSALLAGTSNEQTTMGRKTLTSTDVALTVDDTNNRLEIDLSSSITWATANGNAVSKILFCYDADNTTGTDANITPLLAYVVNITPSGTDVVISQNANGLIRIS